MSFLPLSRPLDRSHKNRMHCHSQEICPQAGMSPEISVRDEHFVEEHLNVQRFSFPVLEVEFFLNQYSFQGISIFFT